MSEPRKVISSGKVIQLCPTSASCERDPAGRVRFRKSSAQPNRRQTLHQGLLYKWGLRRCIQINSERHMPETKNIMEVKFTTYFPILRTLLVKYVIDTI